MVHPRHQTPQGQSVAKPGDIECDICFVEQCNNAYLTALSHRHDRKWSLLSLSYGGSCVHNVGGSLTHVFSLYWSMNKMVDIWYTMMTSSNGNIFRVTGLLCGEFAGHRGIPRKRQVTRGFDVFFDLRPNKGLSKQSQGWWFETRSRPLWRHSNAFT